MLRLGCYTSGVVFIAIIFCSIHSFAAELSGEEVQSAEKKPFYDLVF